jgi:hypothetical protein
METKVPGQVIDSVSTDVDTAPISSRRHEELDQLELRSAFGKSSLPKGTVPITDTGKRVRLALSIKNDQSDTHLAQRELMN